MVIHVAARSQQQLEKLGVAVLGGSVNRRKAVLVALVDVAARSNNLFGPVGKPKGFHYHVALVLVLVSACVDEVVEGVVCGVINIYRNCPGGSCFRTRWLVDGGARALTWNLDLE